jgi:hypothetical protein
MYPLLVSAIASTAGNLLERWSAGAERKAEVRSAEFRALMDKIAGSSKPNGASAASERQDRLESLQSRLLDAPEVRSILDSADPSKPVTIRIAQDGTVLAQAPGREPQAIQVSPETAAVARELASLMPPAGTLSSSASLNFSPVAR